MSVGIASAIIDPQDRWLCMVLEQPFPKLEVPEDAPLLDILNSLAQHCTQTYGDGKQFRMKVWSNDLVLEQEGFESPADVVISSAELDGVPLRRALDQLFARTGVLAWDIRDGILEITSVEALETSPRYKETHVHLVQQTPNLDQLIRDHLRSRQIYFRIEGEGKSPFVNETDETAGTLTLLNNALVVTHNRRAQEAVEELLQTLGVLRTGQEEQRPATRSNRRQSQLRDAPADERLNLRQ
jgi:hypothetical protein